MSVACSRAGVADLDLLLADLQLRDRAPDFGGDYDRPRSEVDDGRESIAMPVRLGDRVLGCINLTWRRQVVSLTRVVQRHLGDLQTAVRTVEERARAVGLG